MGILVRLIGFGFSPVDGDVWTAALLLVVSLSCTLASNRAGPFPFPL